MICKAARLSSEYPSAGIAARLQCWCHVPSSVKHSLVIVYVGLHCWIFTKGKHLSGVTSLSLSRDESIKNPSESQQLNRPHVRFSHDSLSPSAAERSSLRSTQISTLNPIDICESQHALFFLHRLGKLEMTKAKLFLSYFSCFDPLGHKMLAEELRASPLACLVCSHAWLPDKRVCIALLAPSSASPATTWLLQVNCRLGHLVFLNP